MSHFFLFLAFLPGLAFAEASALSVPPGSDLIFLCFPANSRLLITSPSNADQIDAYLAGRKPEVAEFFSSEKLVKWSRDGYRTGSKRIVKHCGEIEIAIGADFPDSNPQGADGAYVFPTVTLLHNKTTLAPTTVISELCEVDTPRWGDCAKDYAVAITSSASGASFNIRYLRTYVESKRVP